MQMQFWNINPSVYRQFQLGWEWTNMWRCNSGFVHAVETQSKAVFILWTSWWAATLTARGVSCVLQLGVVTSDGKPP